MKTKLFALGLWLVGLPAAWAMPEIEHWQTTNGARVYYARAPELPMVDVQVVFDAAAARDGDRPGLAKLVNAMLNEGAAGLSSDTIAERFASLGAIYGNSSLKDMSVLELRSLSDPARLQPALDLLAALIGQPDFPAAALERLRGQMQTSLSMVKQSPARLGSQAFYRGLYADHPYAHPAIGDVDSIAGISGEDLRLFHRRYYVAANAVIAIVGDLDRLQAAELARKLVGGLPRGVPAPALPAVQRSGQGRVQFISYPSTQSHLFVGQPVMARHDPDYFALYVGNHILGGSGLSSILSDEVREKRGLSYSVSSQFVAMRAPGPFSMQLQTRNEKAAEALSVVRDTLQTFLQQGPTEERLLAAKQNITGGFPLRLDSNAKITRYLAMIGFYGLELDYLQRFSERVQAVTAEQVRDAFRRRVDPGALNLVLVGRVQDEGSLRQWLTRD